MSDAASNWGSAFATAAADAMSAYDEFLVPSLFAPWTAVLLDAVNVAPGDHVASTHSTTTPPTASSACPDWHSRVDELGERPAHDQPQRAQVVVEPVGTPPPDTGDEASGEH